MATTNRGFVEELAKRYNVNYEQSDTDKLDEYGRGAIKYRELQETNGGQARPESDWQQAGISTPDQYEGFKKALEEQYKQRGANSTGPADDKKDSPAPPSNPAQAWNQAPAPAPVDPFPSWYRDLMQQQVAQQQAQQAETKQRADALYSRLNERASQSTAIDANDPIIKGQTDAFRNEQTRAQRDYISDTAEQAGPLANIQGERRMAAEKVGQGVSGFQAELLARELSARREEIAQALQMSGGLLSADQTRNLQAQLGQMDQAIKEAGVGMQGRSLDLQRDLGFADLGLRRELGMGGLDLTRRGQDLGFDQFLRELALRQWELGDNSQFRWANL